MQKIAQNVSGISNFQNAEKYSWKYENVITPVLYEDYDATHDYTKHISKEHLLHLIAAMDQFVEHLIKKILLI